MWYGHAKMVEEWNVFDIVEPNFGRVPIEERLEEAKSLLSDNNSGRYFKYNSYRLSGEFIRSGQFWTPLSETTSEGENHQFRIYRVEPRIKIERR